MKFTRYSKFKGIDVSSLNLGDLMDALSDSVLQSGYDEDYYWTRQRREQDTSLDALRRALLQALIEQGLIDEQQIAEMLADNEGQFKGSQVEEMLNQLIERLVEEGYLNLKEEQTRQQRERRRGGRGLRTTAAQHSFRGDGEGARFSWLQDLEKSPGKPRQERGRASRYTASFDWR